MTGAAVDQGGPAFEGWAVLELMGHRRLAGYVREVTLAGAGMLRIDVPSYCVGGEGATWCPEHGACTCSELVEQESCLLHGRETRHAADGSEIHATQFYSPASLYCLTPTTEAEARRVAASSRPHPFVRYEAPQLKAAVVPDERCGSCHYTIDVTGACGCCLECSAAPGEAHEDGCPKDTPSQRADGHHGNPVA